MGKSQFHRIGGRRIKAVFAATMVSFSFSCFAGSANIEVDVNKPGVAIPKSFYGLMTEEINHSYDGGLYAELIQNRTFQDSRDALPHWTAQGDARISIDRSTPVNPALPVNMKLTLNGDRGGAVNDGYWGIPVKPATQYSVEFYAKSADDFSGPITASIVLNDGAVAVAKAETAAISGEWTKYTLTLKTAADVKETSHAKFVLSAQGKGSVLFSFVSLFPPTYKDVAGGLRPDLMQLMADMHPSFIRLPGGNYLEGDTFSSRFRWKQMIGPADTRPGHQGCWSYRSSDGMGLPQFMLWCDQLGAEPVLAVFAGYTLNHDHVLPGPELQFYVDEALEEIEYFTGPADKGWGAVRAKDGRVEPYKLQYVEIGNEDFFDGSGSYDGRFAQFYDAIKAKYPQLKIIATTPVKSRKPDLVDDHFYLPPQQMAATGTHYRKADRKGSQIFVGEWASQSGNPTPNLLSGLADAAFLLGLEKDSDQVPIECYAPLLVNVNPRAAQWGTNLIGYNALHSFGSPSYYAQAMLGQNKGDVVLPVSVKISESDKSTPSNSHGAVGVGAWHTKVEYKDLSVTNQGAKLTELNPMQSTAGWDFPNGAWRSDGGVFKPVNGDSETWAFTGDPKWTDYTVNVKARKTGGTEGFIVVWHAADERNYHWWNIGGWGNTRTSVEVAHDGSRIPFGDPSNFSVETNRWYDLRVEVKGNHALCYIDDKLINDANDDEVRSQNLFTSANYINSSGEVVIKVVNLGDEDLDTSLKLNGVQSVAPVGKAIVLQGDPNAVNSIAEPKKIAPVTEEVSNFAGEFRRTFPAHSFTLLRLSAKQQ